MSKRDQPVSTAHLEFQRKRGKKECPGCNDIFGKQHFENHRLKYYNNSIWHCSSKTLKSQETSIDDNLETASPDLASSADENDRPLISIIKAKLKSNLQALNHDSDESDSEEEEMWDNVTIADIDSDFNTGDDTLQYQTIVGDHDSIRSNMPSLLMSLLIFVCTWQACHIIPDIAIQQLQQYQLLFLLLYTNYIEILVSRKIILLNMSYARSVTNNMITRLYAHYRGSTSLKNLSEYSLLKSSTDRKEKSMWRTSFKSCSAAKEQKAVSL
ncbi:unnamed protein product [Mytilus coruscus]|uniref:Uncharacterized protein n=1 Tax=Mytilus coruscus TaxID=42192 RepID=A0A6J8AP01_MYTCO|nr:unnamed protein product [Mytilus coruscus]